MPSPHGPLIGRIFADRGRLAAARRADRLAAVLIALVQAVVAATGWFVDPVWLAVTIAGQLLLGGLAAVYVIGPMRHELGLARYAMPAAAGIAATLFGRLLPGGLACCSCRWLPSCCGPSPTWSCASSEGPEGGRSTTS